MIAEWLVHYFDKPRNRFLCVLGAFMIVPIISSLRRDIKGAEKILNERVILLGRLELTAKLLSKWWSK